MRRKDVEFLTDSQLIGKLQNGDVIAFEEIYNRYWGILFIQARKILLNDDEAKDAVQEVFISLYSNAPHSEIHTSLKAYLFNAVRNRTFNVIAHSQIVEKYIRSFQNHLAENQTSSTFDIVFEKELVNKIEIEIQKLPSKMKEIFELSRIENLSHKDIAQRLNISDKTVKKQISNAIKILRSKLTLLFLTIFF
jgi:RNA polymerase sigma-70 factor, ECF subfamily